MSLSFVQVRESLIADGDDGMLTQRTFQVDVLVMSL